MQRWSHESRSRVCGIILAACPLVEFFGARPDRPGSSRAPMKFNFRPINWKKIEEAATWIVTDAAPQRGVSSFFLTDSSGSTHVLFLNFEQFYLVLCMCALAMWLLDSHQMYEESSNLENGASACNFRKVISQSVAMLKHVNFRCVLALLVSHTGIWRTKFGWLDLCMNSLFQYQG